MNIKLTCDQLKKRLDLLQPFPPETLKSLQDMATDKPFALSDILKLHQLFYKRIEPEKAHSNPPDFVEFIFNREVETLRELLRLLEPDGVITPFDGANDGVNQVFALLREHPGWRVPKLVQMMNKSCPTVERYLRYLREQRKIEFRGAPKNGGYFIK